MWDIGGLRKKTVAPGGGGGGPDDMLRLPQVQGAGVGLLTEMRWGGVSSTILCWVADFISIGDQGGWRAAWPRVASS